MLRHKECKLRRFLGEVCHSHSLCWDPQHSQETSSTNGIIGIAEQISLFIRSKAIFRELRIISFLFFVIRVVRYFSCCQRFDICVFTG